MDDIRYSEFSRSGAVRGGRGNFYIPKDFLKPRAAMKAPMIEWVALRFYGQFDLDAGKTLRGRAFAQLISRLTLIDQTGERISLAGSSLRQVAQEELGDGFRDPEDAAGGEAGLEDQDFDFEIMIPLSRRALRSKTDTRAPVTDLLGSDAAGNSDTGRFQLSLDPKFMDGVNFHDFYVEAYAELVDNGHYEATSRIAYKDYVVQGPDYDYTVNGQPLSLHISASPENIEAGTALDPNTFTSRELAYADIPSSILDLRYRAAVHSLSEEDDVLAGYRQTIYKAPLACSITELPWINKFQIRFGTQPAAGSLIVVQSINPRVVAQTAAALHVESISSDSVQVHGTKGKTDVSKLGRQALTLPVRLG